MIFCSPVFLFFFLPVTLLCYYGLGRGVRNWVLAIASLIFYAYGEWRFVPILAFSIALNYWIAIGLDNWRGQSRARYLLFFGVASDLSLLIYFKYAHFLIDSFSQALACIGLSMGWHLAPIALPLGISFFTFHKISYKVDVFRSSAKVRWDPLELTLYILLFPQLIAGPIIRYHEIADQITRRTVTMDKFAEGVRRFIVGLAKKMLIANTLARVADDVFTLPAHELTTAVAWLGIICYALQIYFDFSGYSDMAVGLGRMFGFRFPENFKYPYSAVSITDFWRRWHMSLSRWFRDYLYIPLGGNRVKASRVYANLFIVFFLCGLWHGASWNFVVWGMFHGLFLILERLGLLRVLERCPRMLRHAYAILLIVISWVFFRALTLPYAFAFLGAMFGIAQGSPLRYTPAIFLNTYVVIALVAGLIGCMPIIPFLQKCWRSMIPSRTWWSPALAILGAVGSIFTYAIMFLVASIEVVSSTYNPFIYFRF